MLGKKAKLLVQAVWIPMKCSKNFQHGLMAMPEILEHTDLALILTPEI